jgi:hypothetical protein
VNHAQKRYHLCHAASRGPSYASHLIGGFKMQLYEHKYMDFNLKADRIDFIWKTDTADMDDDAFKWSILRYASFAMEYKITKV